MPVPARRLGWLLTVAGALGLAAAFVLTVEKVRLLQDPAYRPTCSINPILSCGSIMASDQAEVFGFPNPLLGLVGFTVVGTTGVAVLAGAVLPRWWWLGLQAGAVFGVVFVHWLFVQSVYRIGALCPYCMAVWVVTIAVFWYVTLHNLGGRPIVDAVARFHSTILTAWLLLLTALIGAEFWDFWRTLL
ncbi:vitamin K epoxide reductase family protein [Dactylosporangium sp. NPDC049742]|uniref:vitamin K epoxide reductase family protein n=1 Tax=Dactylosporangium sp. NPDC049742 TaxID=3154737 RepID=UPI003427158C